MRSIGKRNIKKLEVIVKDMRREYPNSPYSDLENIILGAVPKEWFGIWECAWAEIARLVSDMLHRGY